MIQNTSAARSSFAQISKVINPLTSAFKTPAGRIGLPLVLLHVLLAAL